MIGHYLLALSEEQEDRVLTQPMRHGGLGQGCLVARAQDVANVVELVTLRPARTKLGWFFGNTYRGVGNQYDDLCRRFGERVNTAIRNRILSNRARRTLQNVSELVGVRAPADTPDHTETT